MNRKTVKDLEAGDKVLTYKPGGVGIVRRIQNSNLFKAEGGCFKDRRANRRRPQHWQVD